MPDQNGHCVFCHHDPLHHTWPGCDFPDERKVEFLPDMFIWVKTCGCTGFDQPGPASI